IQYEPAEKSKSDLYLELLPHINAGTVHFLDNERLILQLTGLERRTSRSGKDSIDHAPNGHDDVANCVAGVVNMALVKDAPLHIPANVLQWSRLPRGMAAFARARATSRTPSTPQTALAMDSVSLSDRFDQSRGTHSYPTTPEQVGSMSWSDTTERR